MSRPSYIVDVYWDGGRSAWFWRVRTQDRPMRIVAISVIRHESKREAVREVGDLFPNHTVSVTEETEGQGVLF